MSDKFKTDMTPAVSYACSTAPRGLATPESQAPSARSAPVPGSVALIEIESYLTNGGALNPEEMDHRAVRDMVILCRTEIERLLLYCGALEQETDSIGLQKAQHVAGLRPRNIKGSRAEEREQLT